MIININDKATVRLTEVGLARWRGLGKGSDNVITAPLWELMSAFGPGMYMGMPEIYFVDNEIRIDKLT